ncbi:hypothetical protein BD310DRAFT_923931 [Dichomitus squalens]|uniref:Uncharacterized protein n=1 Tax=Dichomitus squalens TaxID=114155 RepID=A0A4Q9PYX0_9APHY|nr:hypothetical protein BD310DRAFT_923931 [Dichomitus squalens]
MTTGYANYATPCTSLSSRWFWRCFPDTLLWVGIHLHCGKSLAAFLKAIGFTPPLMDGRDIGQLERKIGTGKNLATRRRVRGR